MITRIEISNFLKNENTVLIFEDKDVDIFEYNKTLLIYVKDNKVTFVRELMVNCTYFFKKIKNLSNFYKKLEFFKKSLDI